MSAKAYEKFLSHLRCPETSRQLDFLIFNEAGSNPWPDGVLVADKRYWYPVIDGVPRLLIGPMREDYHSFWRRFEPQLLKAGLTNDTNNKRSLENESNQPHANQQTAESFGVKWNSQPQWGFEGGSAKMINDWLLAKYGWESPEAYQNMVAAKRRILDAGTGLGREVIRCAQANGRALVFGIDLSESVTSATKHSAAFENTTILQTDLLAPPFAPSSFDLILAEGVLHHTPDTRAALMALVRLLEPGGEIGFYVYRQKGPAREFCDDFLRDKIGSLNPNTAWQQVEALTRLGKALSSISQEIEVPAIEALDIPAGRYSVQRLIYWHFLKCFWNDELSFKENNLVNFDWYHPRYAHRHTLKQVQGWLQEANLEPVWVNEEKAGITVRATKES